MSDSNLKIGQIEIYKLKIPLKEPFVISLGAIENAENVLVIIRTDQGISGYGECSPYMTINGESVDSCFIVGQYFARMLKNRDPLLIEDCATAMDDLIYANSSIKSAFDMALHDIAAPYVAGVDWTPVTSRFPAWTVPVLVAVTGITFEVLRHATTGPVGHKGDAEPAPKAGD